MIRMAVMTDDELIRKDFRNFLYLIWKYLRLPDPTPLQYEIADYLQEDGIFRRIIEGFRGVAKSWITAAYVLWRLYIDPDYKFLVVSASKQRANNFSTFTRMLIREVPFLQHLQAHDHQRDSNVAFDVGLALPDQAPSVMSVGVFGQLTGTRANEIIADDVEVPNNSGTQDLREKLLKTVLEFEAIIKPGGRITFLGTPQTEESIYNKLRERGYDCRIWPARYPAKGNFKKYNGQLAKSIMEAVLRDSKLVGKPTEPTRFTELDLLQRETSYGKSGFALQFMLDTSLSDTERYPLKLSDLIVTSLNTDKAPVSVAWGSSPEYQIKELANIGFTGDRWYKPLFVDKDWIEYEGSVMAIDPAGRGTDELGYAVVKQLHGTLFVTATGGLKGGYSDENLIKLAKVAKEQKVNYIVIEANFGDGMFAKIFTPVLAKYHPCTVEEVKHSVQKEKRIVDTLEPAMNRHRLVFDISVVQEDLKIATNEEEGAINYSLFYQLTRLTRDRGSLKHDDRLDALAIAVAYWVESMARDEERAAKEHRERVFEAELENFMEHVVGFGIENSRWV